MNIKFIEGNLLDSQADVICHQVNCQGKMNSGVAKAIREKYPFVFNKYVEDIKNGKGLGNIGLVPIPNDKYICNIFGQNDFGYDGKRYTSYDAIWDALSRLKKWTEFSKVNSIAFPYKMSSDRGGANWEVIYCMICQIFKSTNINVEIWRLE